jgi:hypothetical protein
VLYLKKIICYDRIITERKNNCSKINNFFLKKRGIAYDCRRKKQEHTKAESVTTNYESGKEANKGNPLLSYWLCPQGQIKDFLCSLQKDINLFN